MTASLRASRTRVTADRPVRGAGPASNASAGRGSHVWRQVHAWLLLLPALVLLVAFTHWPAVATFVDSFFSTPQGQPPGAWVGLDNYQAMVDDPVFWKAVTNNLWFAGATIPLSIGLALLMAMWVNERIPGRALPADGVLHAHRAADDRGGEHLAVLLYAALRPARAGHGAVGPPSHNWLGDPAHGAGAASRRWRSGRKPASS